MSPIRSAAEKDERTLLTLLHFIVLNLHFKERNSLRIIFKRTREVSESEDAAMFFPPSSSKGSFENNNMLLIGPEELMENQGKIKYLFLFLRYSMEEDGLMSSFPSRNILLSVEGTPLINLYAEWSHSLSK